MSLTINSNSMALNAQRNLVRSSNTLATVFKRLSSGMRVNSAKEDSAGLSISTRMEAQIREHNQAIRNVNDGISLAQVAEGGMQEAMNVLQRMRELAVQAANDTYTSGDRADLELELDELKAHLNSIASDTEFNGQKLLDGSLTGKKIQIGESESIDFDISQSVSVDSALKAYYAFDGDVSDGSENGNDAIVNGGSGSATYEGFVNSNGIRPNFTAQDDSIIIDNSVLDDTIYTDSFSISSWVRFDNDPTNTGYNQILNNADFSLNSGPPDERYSFEFERVRTGATNSGKFIFQIESGVDTYTVASDNQLQENTDYYVTATYDGKNIKMYVDGVLNDSTSFNGLVNQLPNSVNIGRDLKNLTESHEGLIDDLQIYSRALSDAEIQSKTPLLELSVITKEKAERSIKIADVYIGKISDMQTNVGSFQNRLESIQNNLMNTMENTSQARSRIMDADIAQETAKLTTASIIQQAGVAILAQANQQPQIALQLLG